MIRFFRSLFVSILSLWALSSCGNTSDINKDEPAIPGQMEFTSDTDQVRSDGVDAVTFTVKVTDAEGTVHDVTEHAEIYLTYEKPHDDKANYMTHPEKGF